jgi:prolyl-tRNA synthetase
VIYRQSRFLVRPLRETPAGLDPVTAAAVRGGYLRMRPEGPIWMPIGSRVMQRLLAALHSSVRDDGALTAASPLSLETAVDVLNREVRSYRDLPFRLATVPGVDGGAATWLTVAEAEEAVVHDQRDLLSALRPRLEAAGLTLREIAAGWGVMWAHPSEAGPFVWLQCRQCGAAATAGHAPFQRTSAPAATPQAVEEVATPGANTIAALCAQLGIPPDQTLKSLLFATPDDELIFVILRGDLELSTDKLRDYLDGGDLRPADEPLLERYGIVPGFAGPVGLSGRHPAGPSPVSLLADLSIEAGHPFVTGANRPGFHLRGVTYPRDFEVTQQLDLAQATAGAPCAVCGGTLAEVRGYRVAERTLRRRVIRYVDREGATQAAPLGMTNVPSVELFLAVLSAASGLQGIGWPPVCAPFQVHALDLGAGEALARVVHGVDAIGATVLLDDRDVAAGVKFADADWIGSPVRLVAGKKAAAQGGIELRMSGEPPEVLPPDGAVRRVGAWLSHVM